jgi:hypothetical protein
MTLKDKLIQEIDKIPESLISQVFDFVLFIKDRYNQEEITEQEYINISNSLKEYEAGDYLTLEEYEASQK